MTRPGDGPRRPALAVAALAVALAAAGCGAPAGNAPASTAAASTATTASGGATSPDPGPSPATAGPTSTIAPGSSSSTTSVVTAAGAACPAGSVACAENTAAGSAYLESRSTGGTFGFHFVRLGGGVLASLNADRPFYPASSLKVLQHLHALLWAAAQPDPAAALATPIPVYEDSCSGQGSHGMEPLARVLEAMMVDSDNRRANAVQDYFGREAINATAAEVVGTTGTLLAHRFGCGGPANDPANRSTARDLSLLYERLGLGELLDAETAAAFGALMPGPPWPPLEAAMAAGGESPGVDPARLEAFRAGMSLIYKAGWWETNLSVAGLLRLPACPGDPPRAYAFAVFVDEADAVAAGFEVSEVVPVVLAAEIRGALADYAACGG